MAAQAQSWYSYGPMDLQPLNNEGPYPLYFWYTWNPYPILFHSGSYVNSGVAAYDYIIPVQIPQGKIIKNMRVVFIDNDGTSGANLTVTFRRINKYTGQEDDIYEINTGSYPALEIIQAQSDTSATKPSYIGIVNNSCSYYIMVHFGAANTNLKFFGVTLGTN